MRRAAAIALCAALALTAVPRGTVAQAQGDSRDELLAERASVTEALAVAEGTLAEAERGVRSAEDLLAVRVATRDQLVTDIRSAEVEREEPMALRRALAIDVYMAGDPNAASLIEEVIEGNSSMEGVRDRALYSAVVDWANSNITRLDTLIDELSRRLVEVEAEIPVIEADLAERRRIVDETRAERDGLAARVAQIDERLRQMTRAVLTGLPVDEVTTRPILIVKIDNAPPARPQTGLASADIVIEEKVEGGMSRFAALFQSTGSDPVGPVRSARTSDVELFANLGSPLFSYSGSNAGVAGVLGRSSLIDLGPSRAPNEYFRDSSRRAPHNYYTRTSRLWAVAEGGSAPQAIFEFRSDSDPLPAGARPAAGVDLSYGQTSASFTWSAERGGWLRSTDGRAHTLAGGQSIAPANVVVRFMRYEPSSADPRSPHALVTGSGELWVLTAGHVITGRWEQASAASPTRWLDDSGEPIRLAPGRTWIVLPEPGKATLR